MFVYMFVHYLFWIKGLVKTEKFKFHKFLVIGFKEKRKSKGPS